jgi:dCTP deaminase
VAVAIAKGLADELLITQAVAASCARLAPLRDRPVGVGNPPRFAHIKRFGYLRTAWPARFAGQEKAALILTRSAIAAAAADGGVLIEPFAPERLNANSYTFAIADALFEVTAEKQASGFAYGWRPVPLDADGAWLLLPGRLYLATTLERLGSALFVSRLSGRPALGLHGLCVQVTADLGHQGAQHRWTLELVAAVETRLRPGQPVGQISFWRADGQATPYRGVFGHSDHPVRSRLHTEVSP